MKTLYLLRHAKAELHSASQKDEQRALDESGREAAFLLGEFFASQHIMIDHIACSAAVRTTQTAQAVLEGWGRDDSVAFDPSLYLASAGALFSHVQGFDDAHNSALLVGHNPGIHQLAVTLAGSGNGESMQLLKHKFPTCALAVIALDVERWGELAPDIGHVKYYRDRHTETGDAIGRRSMY